MRGLASAAGILAILLLAPLGAAESGPPYRAESLWGAKHAVGLDQLLWVGRLPWEAKVTGRDVRVAVIDTGIDPTHPDLRDALACGTCWRDFVGDRSGLRHAAPYDDHGHGTHVAGILAGRGHFQYNPLGFYWLTGLRGVAPDAGLIVAKAMRFDGEGEDPIVARAMRWSMDPNGDGDLSDGADVINLSLGIETPSDKGGPGRGVLAVGSEVREAVRDAVAAGVVVVVSSGNDGADRVTEPGDIPEVVTVAATDRDGNVAAFSNVGAGLDVFAPGVLVSSYPRGLDLFDVAQDGYVGMAGTSMAAPVVAGVIALMMDADPALRAKGLASDHTAKVLEVQRLLRETSDVVGAGDERVPEGVGLVDAYAVVSGVDRGARGIDPVGLVLLLVAATVLGRAVMLATRRRATPEERALSEAEEAGPGRGP